MAKKQAGDLQENLRVTAAEFTRVRGALQQAGGLPVVTASPAAKLRVAVLNKRAGMIQTTIESVGKMIDGARRWYADTFGTEVESQVPAANPTIGASMQTSIAAMNYFIRDAKAELDSIVERQKVFESLPEDKRGTALAELKSEVAKPGAAPFSIPRKWLVIGALAVGALFLLKGGDSEA